MSLVGTRPPTVDEWDKYELHHRARLATKPGLTGMWQVSGRSNITDLRALFFLDENHNGIHLIDDQYSIALQKIIENFTHYLSVNDGYGDVIYESRNNTGENSAKSPDIKLINVYHKIQANNKGIVYNSNKYGKIANSPASFIYLFDTMAIWLD